MKNNHLITILILLLFCSNKLSAQIKASDFRAKADVTTLKYPTGVNIADMDGDGKKDVIIANEGIAFFSVYRNTVAANADISSATFASSANFSTGNNSVETLIVADMNQDGLPDVLACSYSNNLLCLFRNISVPGAVAFATRTNINLGYYMHNIAAGDINGDGLPDLAVVNSDAGTVTLYRNTSTSTTVSFATGYNIPVGGNPTSVTLTDLDGDNKLDMAVLLHDKALVSVYRNISAAGATTIDSTTFATRQDIATEAGAYAMAAADMNNDNKPDLAITNINDQNTVSIFPNTSVSGTVSFATQANFATGTHPLSIKLADINGDGKPDIITGNWTSAGTISVLQNSTVSGGTIMSFYPQVSLTAGGTPQAVAVADMNADSKPDIVSANSYSSTFSVLEYKP
ncbi:FG-GAP repeat domain-containing protein [Mucilaginibacter sp. Mucisp86]|uniref:FG-GAP repeat domain-containing protein n=1 Tax=Mucilaginibacter sp. Mucisp86 TaxID=3243060 RepID=UPI0039B3CC26